MTYEEARDLLDAADAEAETSYYHYEFTIDAME